MTKNKTTSAYFGLFFVVLVWGVAPLLTYELQKYYSPSFKLAVSSVILLTAYLLMSLKHLKDFNLDYIKVGVPTGIFLALANVTQKIGLLYTTPARYAFLENLSCVVVPVLMFFLIKKKIKLFTVLASLLCLGGVFVLNGISLDGGWGVGELLCAASGILYGFNIAGTGAFAKKLYAPLYLAVQSVIEGISCLTIALVLDGMEIEKIAFPTTPKLLFAMIAVCLVSSALCWPIRTNAMKYVPASTVSVIMPFSAVITTLGSVIMGLDVLDVRTVLGGVMITAAIILSSRDK